MGTEEKVTKKKKIFNRMNIFSCIIFSAYIIFLVIIAAAMFDNSGLHTKKRVSIYKVISDNKADSDAADTETPDDTLSDMEKTEADTESDGENEYEIELTQPVELKQIQSTADEEPEQELYNGEELKDNGCTYAVKVNRQENIVTVYALDEQGYYTVPVRCMICSTAGDDNTPLGLYETSYRLDWAALIGGVYGQYAYQIYGDILFHSVPYETDSKDRLETWEYAKLGTAASLGCVRLCVADAKWIFYNCEEGTQVNIFDSDYYGPMGKPAQPYELSDTENPGWDPTDMTEGNPYLKENEGIIFGAKSRIIELGEPFDERAGVMAFSADREDVTDSLKIEGTVNENVRGCYDITYSFDDGINIIKKDIVIVVVDSSPPVIETVPEEIHISADSYQGDEEKLAELIGSFITAYSNGKQISIITPSGRPSDNTHGEPQLCIDTRNINKAGTYSVYCFAIDKNEKRTEKVIVNVIIE
ncbi:MAG: L,D-transpeptidase family protein [Coprococcus sp.]